MDEAEREAAPTPAGAGAGAGAGAAEAEAEAAPSDGGLGAEPSAPEPAPLTPQPAPLGAPAASTREAPREEDKPPGADDDADEVMQEGSTGGPLSPMRPAVPPRARSPEVTTLNPHALKISRGGDGDQAALDGAFDAVQ